jgi:hypothetical protein
MYRSRAEVPCKNGFLLIPFQAGEEARVVEISGRFRGIPEGE